MSAMIGVTSARTSPGASSLVLGLAWALRRRSISPFVIEADGLGGVFGQRLGLPPQPSLSSMVRDARQGLTAKIIFDNAVQFDGVSFLQAPVDPVAAEAAVDGFGRLLEQSDINLKVPTLLDLGRFSSAAGFERSVRSLDHTILVTSPYLEDVQSARFALRRLAELESSVGLVVVGSEPHPPEEVADSLGVRLLGGVAHDPETASALRGGRFSDPKFKKSMLARSIDALATTLLGVLK